MSYRSIKRVLGETSLERKCRILFGMGLLVLITGSFFLYEHQTSALVMEQNKTTARLLVAPIILAHHLRRAEKSRQIDPPEELQPAIEQFLALEQSIEQMALELKPEELKNYSWTLLKGEGDDPTKRPNDLTGYRALDEIRSGKKQEVTQTIVAADRKEYHYYGVIRASDSCVRCHQEITGRSSLAVGDVLGVVKIAFPLEKTERALAFNKAVLISTAFVTVFLAMLGAYAIVRYVIVKPVLHLKDVSEAITQGKLDQRADIRTGDEFEELSHTINRMLRHLVNVQEELREANAGLNTKLDELAQVNLKLYEMNKLKNEFLATMSHELRTPLNSILGFSDVLISSPGLTEKQQRFLGHIQSSGKSLLNLITDILDLAKIESGKLEVVASEFSLMDLVERSIGSFQLQAEKKNISVTSEFDTRLPVLLQDLGKLQQILNNLLSNAIKFTPEGGRVKVCGRRSGHDRFELVVEDTGVGIPLEDQEKVFEKFRQGRGIPGQENMLTREFAGTGLGLSIVRELTRLLGGEVRLNSEFGKGSTFTVTLPARLGSTDVSDSRTKIYAIDSRTPLPTNLAALEP